MTRKYTLLFTALTVSSVTHADISSSVGVETVYDDNIYRLESNESDAWITKIKPAVTLEAGQGLATYSLLMSAEAGVYSQSKLGDDDYTDYQVEGVGSWEFNIRNRFEMDLYQSRGHDDRGTGRMDVIGKLAATPGGDFDEPDQWLENGIGGEYRFGAPHARGAVSVSGGYSDKDYDNNAPSTDRLDRADTDMRLLGLLKVMPRTSLLLEGRWKDIDYQEDLPNRDSQDTRYFVGAQWEATAKTTGSVRLGYQQKDPDDTTAFEAFDSSAWEVDVVWAPRTYSTLQLTAFRGVDDSSDALNYVDYETYTARWKHKWSDRLTSAVYGELETQNYENSFREDDIGSWGFLTSYEIIKHINLNGEYRYEDRNSSITGLDYERNMVILGAEMSFE